jgi:tetratricopeptide (TPR) repeat protein
VYGRLNEYGKAFKELMTAIWLQPENDNMKINLAVLHQRMGEYDKAEEIMKLLIGKFPESGIYHFRLGMIYKEAGQYEGAVSEFLKSVELAPDIINPYIELGNTYATGMKDLEKAKYYYSKGIEMAPKAKSKVEDLRWMVQDLER